MKRVGIIGGAGHKAGLFLVQRIVTLCQEKYGCWQDADFPQMTLLNIPFQDMLGMADTATVRLQLQGASETGDAVGGTCSFRRRVVALFLQGS